MPTRLYLRDDWFHVDAGTISVGEKSTTLPLGLLTTPPLNDSQSLALLPGVGTLQRTRSTPTTNSTAQQSRYVARFVSPPLAAQTIAAQTWTLGLVTNETNTGANSFTRPVIYLWRPSASAVVGFVYDAAANIPNAEWTGGARTNYGTLSGSAVTAQAGDVLVFEVWAYSAAMGLAGVYNQILYFNGTVEPAGNNQSSTSARSFLEASGTGTITFSATATTRTHWAGTGITAGSEAALVSQNSFSTTAGFRFKGQLRTVQQMPASPAIDDVPWIVWCSPDASNYYAFRVGTNGSWLLERNVADVKTAIASGAAGTLPNLAIGRWYDFDVVHTPSGYISVTWGTTLVVNALQDTARTTGNFGFFARDCEIEVDNISSTEFASDFQSAAVATTTTAGTSLATNWIVGSVGGNGGGIRDSFAPATPQNPATLSRPSDPVSGTNGTAMPAGVAASAAAGDATESGSATTTVTGVSSMISTGTVTAQGFAQTAAVGQSSTTALGTATATGGTGVINGTATPTGIAASAVLGSAPASGPANATAPGVPATSAAGTATVTRTANIAAVGVAATSALGAGAASVSRNVTATGAAAASAPGTAAATGAATRLATGVAGASALGTVAAGSFQAVAVTGLSAAALPGTASASGFANGMPAGLSATPAAGAAAATGATVVNGTAVASGMPAATAVGTPAGTGRANVSVTGLTAAAAIGAATATGGTVVNGNASATGQPMSSLPGAVQAAGPARANAVGIAASAAVGTATATGTVVVSGQANPAGVAANAAAASPEGRGAARISPAGASAGSALGAPQRTAGAAAVPAGLSGLLSLGTASAAGQIFIDGWALPAGLSMASALGRTDETVVFTAAPGGAGFPMRPDETMRLTDAGAARQAADWPARRPDAGRGRPRESTRTR